MTTHTLPHDPYIAAIEAALTEAKLEAAQVDVRDSETRGIHLYLDAVITLTPEASGIDADRYEHGLILVWEWHTGLDEDERGPVWQWAHLNEDGSNWPPEPLPVPGWVAPEMLTAAIATLAHTGTPTPMASTWHEHLRAPVEAAIEAWAAKEGS